MTERIVPSPGDMIEWRHPSDPKFNHVWKVFGCHHGAMGQESVIEVENVSHIPAWTGHWQTHIRMYIPDCLLWNCRIIEKDEPDLSGQDGVADGAPYWADGDRDGGFDGPTGAE